MRQIYLLSLILIGFLLFTQTTFANEINADLEALPSSITYCYGGVVTLSGSSDQWMKCGWWRTYGNNGPDHHPLFTITDTFYPSTSNAVGPSSQGPSTGSCYPGNCIAGFSHSRLFETYLKVGVPIDHTVKVIYSPDPSPSNNQFVEAFIIMEDGSIIQTSPFNNYYNNNYNNGFNNGYNNGYMAPWNIVSNGSNNSYNNGYNNGYNNNFNNGYVE